jgi:hypothetical protein
MENRSIRVALAGPTTLCAVMLLCASVIAYHARVDFSGLFAPYLSAALTVTAVAVLITVFLWVLQLAKVPADNPLSVVWSRLKDRGSLLILPLVVFPLFLAGFTATKTSIPFIVGYSWDGVWANADKLIFGDDAWRITHRWFGERSMPAFEWAYTAGWGAVLIFSKSLVALNASPKRIAVFYTAMMGTWLIGGILLAFSMSAAGPVFAHLFDPSLSDRFSDLRSVLNQGLSKDGLMHPTQLYLAASINDHVALRGGGISAFPSMHLGAASIYVLAARGTQFLIPSLAFWLLIFVCSAYFGYHYWVDGIAAAAVAIGCWALAERFYGAKSRQHAELSVQPA